MEAPSIVHWRPQSREGRGPQESSAARMHALLSVGPPDHTARKWDRTSSCLWGMPAEWGVRADACGHSQVLCPSEILPEYTVRKTLMLC